MEHAEHHLFLGDEQENSSKNRTLLHWGSLDLEKLLAALSKMGINSSVEDGKRDAESQTACVVHIQDPHRALIEVGTRSTIITAANENVASLIYEAIDNILDGV